MQPLTSHAKTKTSPVRNLADGICSACAIALQVGGPLIACIFAGISALDPDPLPGNLRQIAGVVFAGMCCAIFGKIIDLRQQRHIRGEMAKQASYIRAVLDAIPGHVSWVNEDLTYIGVNQSLASAWNLDVSDFTGKHVGFLSPNHPTDLSNALGKFFANDADVLTWEAEVPVNDGEQHTQFAFTAAKYFGGKAAVIIGIDVSVLKQTQVDLAHRESLLAYLLESMPHGIYAKTVREPARFIIWNQRMETLTGIPRTKAIQATDADIYSADEARRMAKIDAFVVNNHAPLDLPEETLTRNNQVYVAHSIRVPVIDDHGNVQYLLGVVEDITEARAREDMLRHQQAQLLHAGKLASLGEITGGIAHEVNNPLSVILGYARRLVSSAEKQQVRDPESIKHIGEKIITMAERIARIIRGLKSFARDASDDPTELTSVVDIVNITMQLCETRLSNHGIKISVNISPDLTIDCRPVQVSQALLNLLSNSHDAIRNLEDKWIVIDCQERDNDVQIAVTDSGRGIPPQIADKLMQPFFTTKSVGSGTGLGLSTVKGILEAHGGRLEYDATVPNTKFVMIIPKGHTRTSEKVA